MFRGNAPARIDEKGRLKVPNAFRSLLEEEVRPRAVPDQPDGRIRARLPDAGVARDRSKSSAPCRRPTPRGFASSIA